MALREFALWRKRQTKTKQIRQNNLGGGGIGPTDGAEKFNFTQLIPLADPKKWGKGWAEESEGGGGNESAERKNWPKRAFHSFFGYCADDGRRKWPNGSSASAAHHPPPDRMKGVPGPAQHHHHPDSGKTTQNVTIQTMGCSLDQFTTGKGAFKPFSPKILEAREIFLISVIEPKKRDFALSCLICAKMRFSNFPSKNHTEILQPNGKFP